MEPYVASNERPLSDPGSETGLEEPMWQLDMGGAKPYPERPAEADCIYYLRTGFCGYGTRCRFNHPPDRSSVVGPGRAGVVEYPERMGQPVCQYYMRTGTCKFGASCKFHHPRHGAGSTTPAVPLNYYGYPFRPGEKECSYYVKTGQCKFGATCKFHHPQPAGIQVPSPGAAPQLAPLVASSLYPAVQSPQQYGVVVARPPLVPPYLHGAYGPMLLSPGMVPYPSWTPYQATVSPVASSSTQPTSGSGSMYGVTQFSPPMSALPGQYQPSLPSVGAPSGNQKEQSLPERPGQPECQYYMKTGYCKYGSSCRYHHPPDLVAQEGNAGPGPVGLPLRPGVPTCTHYAQHGVCKFGQACKFNHPMGALSYSPSASSLADMPVAPFPVGSSIGTLAPSSSSELRPELITVSFRDSSSMRSSSLMSASSVSVGSTLSKGEPVPHSTAQKSSLSPGSSPGNNSSRTTEDQSSS